MASERSRNEQTSVRANFARASFLFICGLLAVEFIDELVDGVRGAAWPLIRADLRLSYSQIGMLLSVPTLVAAAIEMGVGVLGDVWNRRALVLGGGVFFALGLAVFGFSQNFYALLAAAVIFYPASGAFVNLSQAALMDSEPRRREQNMARWTLAGSAANVAGPLALAAAVWAGAGWRELFLLMSLLTLGVLLFVRRFHFPLPAHDDDATEAGEARRARGFKAGVSGALGSLRRKEVWRWLVLLEVGDLTGDVLKGFLALYFVDVVGASESEAAFAVLIWVAVGLPGDALVVPVLERVRGLVYLRATMAATLLFYAAFMLARSTTTKLILLGLLGLANAGWYSVLKARLYAELPGQSGTVMTISNVSGIFGGLVPLAVGALAERFGLGATMWLFAAGPVLMLAGLLTAPRGKDEGGRMKTEGPEG
ncbi:MAG TPA: MFS transporter [Pyrinomonadaceae bacterium]|nr:MFS transporter [Pyrinomonadaceae bacterium]